MPFLSGLIKKGLQAFTCFFLFFCNLPDESMFSFGWLATPEEVHNCILFSPHLDNSCNCGSLESQSLKKSLSRVIDVNGFASRLFLNLCWIGAR